jgi:hypothetical protein
MKAGPGDPAKTAAHRDKNQSKKPCQVHRLSNDTLIFYSTARDRRGGAVAAGRGPGLPLSLGLGSESKGVAAAACGQARRASSVLADADGPPSLRLSTGPVTDFIIM